MQTSENIRAVAKDLVVAYTRHVKIEVENNNQAYINCGLDSDIDIYQDLFSLVMGKVLGVRYKAERKFPRTVVNRLVKHVKEAVKEHGHGGMVSNGLYGVILYDLCLTVLESVRAEQYACCS